MITLEPAKFDQPRQITALKRFEAIAFADEFPAALARLVSASGVFVKTAHLVGCVVDIGRGPIIFSRFVHVWVGSARHTLEFVFDQQCRLGGTEVRYARICGGDDWLAHTHSLGGTISEPLRTMQRNI